jgi:hypothetical protein
MPRSSSLLGSNCIAVIAQKQLFRAGHDSKGDVYPKGLTRCTRRTTIGTARLRGRMNEADVYANHSESSRFALPEE